MNKKFIVRLSIEERKAPETVVDRGKAQAYRIKHANILLAADADGPDWSDEKIAEAFHDCDYPSAEKIVLVCDNLNTHRG